MLKKMYHLDLDAKNITHKLNFLGMQKRYTRTTKKNFKRATQNAVQKKKKREKESRQPGYNIFFENKLLNKKIHSNF